MNAYLYKNIFDGVIMLSKPFWLHLGKSISSAGIVKPLESHMDYPEEDLTVLVWFGR